MDNYPLGATNDPKAPYNERTIDIPEICEDCETDRPEWEYFDEEDNYIILKCGRCNNRICV